MKNTSSSQGFTLIELMTSVALFSIFIIIMAGVFSRFVETERHSIAQGSLILDVQSAMESFVKEARTGYGSTYQPEGGKKTAFRNQAGDCVSYRVNTVTHKGKNIGVFERAARTIGGNCTSSVFATTAYVPLTSRDTDISEVFFDVTLSAPGATSGSLANQGVITLSLTAKSSKNAILPIRVQNTVTSRQVAAYE